MVAGLTGGVEASSELEHRKYLWIVQPFNRALLEAQQARYTKTEGSCDLCNKSSRLRHIPGDSGTQAGAA